MQLARLSVLVLFILAGCINRQGPSQEVKRSTEEIKVLIHGQPGASPTAEDIRRVKCSVEKKRYSWVLFKYIFWGQGGSEEIWKEKLC